MKVVVATCQLPTSADTEANLHHVLAQMREAKAGGAQVAHFREGCLSGYAGTDFKSFANFNWALLETSTHKALEVAREPATNDVFHSGTLVHDPRSNDRTYL
jgi:predicted amidohydrolase